MAKRKSYLLGTPLKRSEQRSFLKALIYRHNGDYHEVYKFIDGVLDRISSKSASLLSFNSIFAGLSFALHVKTNSYLAWGAMLASAVSCLLLLDIIALNWDRESTLYQNIKDDVTRNLGICVRRSFLFTLSLIISLVAILQFILSLLLNAS